METPESTTLTLIKQQLAAHPLILYMKGTPEKPCCGFSKRAAQILSACGAQFVHINILENPEIRSMLPRHSNWPTFPQLYYQGELIGGCDIMEELHKTGELQKKISKT